MPLPRGTEISTDRLVLLPGLTPQIRIVNWLNDRNLMRYSEQRHQIHTLESQADYLAHFDHYAQYFYWEIWLKNTSNIIGSITADIDLNNKVADLGIMVGWYFQKRGYALEAWNRVIKWLFDTDRARKVEAGFMDNNTAMHALANKAGMHGEGFRINHFWWEGQGVDLRLYGKLK